jgi:hypothetical protein
VSGEIGGIGELDRYLDALRGARAARGVVGVGQVELGRPDVGDAEWCESS